MNIKLTDHYKVAIVGRPNVGKSSLFNRFVGRRTAIVDAVAGITRDRIFAKVVRGRKVFDLIDTGGFFEGPEDSLEQSLLEQVARAIGEAELVLLVMDAQTGVHPMDRQIFKNLRHLGKPFLFVVNKADNGSMELESYDFFRFGGDRVFAVSALHNRGVYELEKAVLSRVPEREEPKAGGFRMSIVGKPNAGKSSLANRILGCERTIVNEKPGTTRDAVEIDFYHRDEPFTLVDTAGLTRRGRVKEPVDAYSIMRAEDAIGRSDLVMQVLDAGRPVESQDLRIARSIIRSGRCMMLVVNKWDLVKGIRQEHYLKHLKERIPFIGFVPVVFVSVIQGRNLEAVMRTATELRHRAFKRVPTALLNQVIESACTRNLAPYVAGKRLKIYYATQTSVAPPTFSLFVNSTRSAAAHYLKYLEHQLRAAFEFQGTPIRLSLKPKRR